MSKPVILQVGPYPDWDQTPIDAAFDAKRLFEASDKAAFLQEHGPQVRAIATLDVFEGEPALDARFLDLDNVLLQPHHASGTIETRKAMGRLLRDNLTAHFAGEALPTPVL